MSIIVIFLIIINLFQSGLKNSTNWKSTMTINTSAIIEELKQSYQVQLNNRKK